MGILEKLTKETGTHIFELSDGRQIELDAKDIENIFKGYRPRNLDAKDFRIISKIIKKEIQHYTKSGTMIHLSKVTPEVWKAYFDKGLVGKHSQKGHTYVRKNEESK